MQQHEHGVGVTAGRSASLTWRKAAVETRTWWWTTVDVVHFNTVEEGSDGGEDLSI